MKKNEVIIVADYSHVTPLSLDEIIEMSHSSPTFVEELIEFGILHPEADSLGQWVFDMQHMHRIQIAQRLHDLEINMAGIAVVLDLLDQLDEMAARIALLEKHYMK